MHINKEEESDLEKTNAAYTRSVIKTELLAHQWWLSCTTTKLLAYERMKFGGVVAIKPIKHELPNK